LNFHPNSKDAEEGMKNGFVDEVEAKKNILTWKSITDPKKLFQSMVHLMISSLIINRQEHTNIASKIIPFFLANTKIQKR
jgi:hypothetical protein